MIDSNPKLQKSILDSLSIDGRDPGIYPYLSYLVQDFWNMGASPKAIIQLIKKHQLNRNPDINVLDLGCGKGSVSVSLAREFGFSVHGIDGFPGFIEEAKQWAQQYGVSNLCRFEQGDIRQRVFELHNYDMIVLGSIGPILGNIRQTVEKIKSCIHDQGRIILDDAYIPDNCNFTHERFEKRSHIVEQFRENRLTILDEQLYDESDFIDVDANPFDPIQKRVDELIAAYPDKRQLFEAYIESQERDNEIVDRYISYVTWLLKPEPFI